MTDDKLRRVSLFPGDGVYGNYYEDDPGGTHHLTHVDHYVPVKREVWRKAPAKCATAVIKKLNDTRGFHTDNLPEEIQQEFWSDLVHHIACALAEIGGEDD